jgi:2-oxoglutarate/2-oxoacid ferredoxin oxidoreductase subunit beta
MPKKELNLNTKNTWCPGCGNFPILTAFKNAISSLIKEGTKEEEIVLVGGIGCSSKIIDYINLNSFSSLHGRPLVSAEGIKMSNPKLKVIVFAGDGGTYNEGISHLIHAAKRNIDITLLVHNNRTFALTTSQFTATSPKGFKGKSTPEGSVESPFNPLELMLSSNASFISRGYSFELKHLERMIKEGINHKGFSFIEILQPCITFFNTMDFYNKRIYKREEKDLASRDKALKGIREWDYKSENTKIPLGIFYKEKKPSYEELLLGKLNPSKRKRNISLKNL